MKPPDRLRALIARIQALFANKPEMPPRSSIRKARNDGSIDDGVLYELPDYAYAMAAQLSQMEPEAQTRALNEVALREANTSYASTFDNPYRGPNDEPFAFTEAALVEWPWSLRQAILVQCHTAYHRNPIARRAVDYFSGFVVGEGFQLTCKNKDVEKVLADFIDHPDNAIREREQQVVRDLVIDGELFWQWIDGSGDTKGMTTFIPMRPWECQWVNTELGFYRRPLDYRFIWRQTYGDAPYGQQTSVRDIPAENMLHVAINQHSYEVRGRSMLYVVLPWLRAYKEWLENRSRQNHWRGALLWWVKLIGARPETVAAKAAQYSTPPTPGSIAVTTDKEEWTPLVNSAGGADAGNDGTQLKMMNAVGFGIPLNWLADGETANRAIANSQQVPALMTMGQMQQIMVRQVWTPIFRRVLQNAVNAGLLPARVIEQDDEWDALTEPVRDKQGKIVTDPATGKPREQDKLLDTTRAFEVRYEPLGDNKDLFTLAQAMQIALANSLVSEESASREMGFDPSAEKKRMKREEEARQNDVAAGKAPPPVGLRPQAMSGEPPVDANGQPGANGQQQAAINGNGANGR